MSCPTGTPPATVGLLTALLRGTGCSAAQQHSPCCVPPSTQPLQPKDSPKVLQRGLSCQDSSRGSSQDVQPLLTSHTG